MIRLENIKRDFKVGSEIVHALRGISFSIKEGEFVTIMGTSGSGKSTLLNTLGCLDTPTSGEYYLDGVAVRTMNKDQRATLRNRKIGFVFQAHHLLPEFTALENVMVPALIGGASASQAKERALNLLEEVGLSGRASHKPSELSGGEQQRVAIARAIVQSPSILFADEPSGNLDSRTKEDIHSLFFSLRDTLGQTIVIVTHDEGLAAQCDRALTMRDGLII